MSGISLFGIMAGYISLNMPLPLLYLSLLSPLTWGSYVLANLTFRYKNPLFNNYNTY
jgi:hypothetical protein